jgi:hypothetical protein
MIKEDRSARNMDRGQLNKQKKDHGQLSKIKKSPVDDLEHLMRKKERQAGEALKTQVKLT